MPRSSEGVLARYTRDLTADARAGRLDPIRCRDAEVARVTDVLLRRDKNNPVLLGDAGVGKTAVAEALALRLAAGDVPLGLRQARLLALDHVGLLAGSMYRGQYEERIRGLVDEVSAAGDVILFVDELHNLIGQGTAIGVAMDAANMLKPALARGQFRVLGATTSVEYDRWIRTDPALDRRFQPVVVRELSPEETQDVLEARREVLERHHAVAIADVALVAAIRLTDLFLPERRRPDRALDALDEACAHLHGATRYDEETERMVQRLRALERQAGTSRHPGGADAVAGAGYERPGGEGAAGTAGDDAAGEAEEGPSWGRFAHDGAAALERLGAELEAFFAPGELPPAETPHRTRPAAPRAARASGATEAAASTAVLWAALRRRLIETGVVVRGHDVARVVSVMTGKRVTWVD